jgi:hypothetical protein
MAETIDIAGGQVKIRRPWGVFFLSLITLGIYYLVWYYKTNKELQLYTDVKPGIALLAVTLGGLLIIPPFVSEWRYYKRIRQAQEATGTPHPISHVLGFVLYLVALILLPFETVYAQEHLNRLWRHVQSEEEKRAMGMRGEPMAPPLVR